MTLGKGTGTGLRSVAIRPLLSLKKNRQLFDQAIETDLIFPRLSSPQTHLDTFISQSPTMVRISVLNDCLNNIVNAERRGKRQVLIRPSSKVVIKVLSVMQKHGESPSDSAANEANEAAWRGMAYTRPAERSSWVA